MAEKRIIEYDEASTVTNNDYVYMDSEVNGQQKITPNKLVYQSQAYFTLSNSMIELGEDVADATRKTQDLESDLGDTSTLETEDKSSVVGAVNELKADIGDLEDLETEDKSSLVGAINEARGTGGGGSGLTADIKSALLQIAQKVAYIDDDGQTYYDDLYDALYAITAISLNTNSISMQSIGATSQLTATTTPEGGNVTWSSSNTSIATVSSSGLVTSVGYGSATITATAGSVSATCSVTIAQATLTSISAVYTQSGTVYDTDSLNSLKDDLVVTATWSNQTTSVVPSADYTLSGTLTEGTSTITVAYGGKTTTFSVTVTHAPYIQNGLFAYWDAIDNQATGNHDSSATTWVDKINGYTWTPVVTNGTQTWSWGNDALIFAPTQTGNFANSGNAFKCSRPTTGLRTLEVVYTPEAVGACVGEFTSDLTGVTDNTTQIIGMSSSDNTFMTQGVQNGYQAGSLTNIKSIVATYGSSYAPVKAYMNGSEVTSQGSSHSYKYHYHSDMVLGTQNVETYRYPFKGVIHAIRFYDRELTAEEIAQNYADDVARFGLGV